MRTISLLEMLSGSELTRLGKYLKSPFFTNKKHLYSLFAELRRAGRSAAQNPAAHFAKVFSGKPFDEHKWNKALSDLNACIEDFFVVSHVKANQDSYRQALISASFEHLDEPALQRAVRTVFEDLTLPNTPEHVDRLHLRFWSRKQELTHPLTDRIKLGINALDELEQNLDIYYYVSKIQITCNRVAGIKIRNWTGDMNHIQKWLEGVRIKLSQYPSALLKVYCDLLGLQLDAQVGLSDFFSILQQHGPYLHPDELRDVIRIAFNECTYRQRNGDTKAFHWHLEMFKWSNAQGLWDAPGAEEIYLNTGMLFARANMLTEFNRHLGAGQEILPTERKEEANTLLSAYWDFTRSDYAKTEVKLNKIITRHPRYVLLRHSIAVRNACMLFQQGAMNDDAVERVLITFNNFLRYPKNPFSKDVRQPYHNLIGFIRRIIQAASDQKGVTKASLRQYIHMNPPAARDWVEAFMATLPD